MISKRPSTAAALLAAAALSGCGDATQLLVLVSSDYIVPTELSEVRARVSSETGTSGENTFVISPRSDSVPPATFVLPLSFGISGDSGKSVTVELTASDGFRELFTRRAITRFIKHKALVLPMFLSRRCAEVLCPEDQTCTENGCASPVVDPGDLTTGVCAAKEPGCGARQRPSEDGCGCEACDECPAGEEPSGAGCGCCPASCPEGQVRAADGCACVCDTCPSGQVHPTDSCDCVCDTCPSGQVHPADSCACVCDACPQDQVRDAEGCGCHCPECPVDHVQAGTGQACSCACAPTCSGESFSSGDRCCECPSACGYGRQRAANGCDCEACNVQCAADEVVSSTGCSCVRVVDLATARADRAFVPGSTSRVLGNVLIADLGGASARPEVIVGENATVANGTQAGRVSVYDGEGFFTTATSTVPDGALFTVLGRDPMDHLGGNRDGRMLVADVTGDGRADLVISAPNADGPSNTQPDAGEVYVIVGGPGLTGTINLRAPAAGVLGATIYGGAAGWVLQAIAAGDLNGDGIADLVLSAPGDSDPAGGAGSGSAFVILGGPSLASAMDVDLATVAPFAKIVGPGPSTGFAALGVVAQVFGSPAPDLILSAPNDGPGSVWVIEGPLAHETYPLAAAFPNQAYSLRIVGREANDNLGISIKAGQVVGSDDLDLIIGTSQLRYGDQSTPQLGAVDVWKGPLTSPAGDPTRDLSRGDLPDVRIMGAKEGDTIGTVLAIGDLDADGIGDLVISSPSADGPNERRLNTGEVSVVRGAVDLPAVILSTVTNDLLHVYGAHENGHLAPHPQNVAAGDLTGDGRADLCLGSPRDGSGRVDCIRSR